MPEGSGCFFQFTRSAQREIDFQVDIPGDSFWASFDREKVEQIVYNLLGNAFKFSDDGERVSFKASHHAGSLVIEVSDTGRGIAEADLPFIFDRFYQVDDSSTKDHEGSGIGLALTRDLVELMDGTITASSEMGKGTEFEVHIPVERIKTPRATTADEPPQEQKLVDLPRPVLLSFSSLIRGRCQRSSWLRTMRICVSSLPTFCSTHTASLSHKTGKMV